ncbi:chemotaxis protein CheW [Defluviitalea raffinosedens]|uniref:chemotaxis protein CheW n=1 Tax=Defluviitalea raffinosedens TaxID=1450156 RepID=UPI00195C1D1B|nr:chemotaxis protein CheW [Defluviitalea raffinosedens]MBM7686254.1 purine-binding chemotaxis protein CheW [Defluviitalea raffinosedens]
MAGRSSKKKQGNFKKMKKEVLVEQQNGQNQNSEISMEELENDSLIMPEAVILDNVKKEAEDNGEKAVDTKKIELVIFRVGEEEFALKVSNIKEIIRIPSVTEVPNAPEYITGLCSLRDHLLPVIDCRKLFGMPKQEFNENSRIIVTDIHGKMTGLVSDKVLEVINIEETQVNEPPSSIKGIDGGMIQGILVLDEGKRVIMILDAEKITKVKGIDETVKQNHPPIEDLISSEAKEEEDQIIIFSVGKEEYAFSIDYVKEIIGLPDIVKVPNTADYIEGMFSIRNELLAAINLGKYFGMKCEVLDKRGRVIIINNGFLSYGIIVDKVSNVVQVQKQLLKENVQDAMFAGIGFTKGIYNLNNGQRLIMMLEPDQLIHLEDIQGILEVNQKESKKDSTFHPDEVGLTSEYVIFRIDEEEYGIAIHKVQEVNRIDEITHFPGAPQFIAGMVDLRGEVIPILNLRKMFGLQDLDSYCGSKFLVAEFENKKIGILIDSVSGVLRFSEACIEKASEALKEKDQNCYIDKIAKLNDGKRMVLILNLSALLSFM